MRSILSIILLLSATLSAQPGPKEFPLAKGQTQKDVIKLPTTYNVHVNSRPPVNFNIFADIDHARQKPVIQLRLGTAVMYDLLQFEKSDLNYISRYEISFAVRDKKNALFQENWKQEVYLNDFNETNARDKFDEKSFEIDLENKVAPGEYEAWMEIRDLISRKNFKSKRNITIPDLTKNSHTEIVFIKHSHADSGTLQISTLKNVIEFGKPSSALLRAVSASSDTVLINLRLYRKVKEADKLFVQEFINVIPENGLVSLYYELPVESMPEGDYNIRILSDELKFESEKRFSVIWFKKPVYLYKNEMALEPMRYILSEEEFEKVKSLDSDAMSSWIDDYWQRKDPTPETIYNELSYEFYERVVMANQRYSIKNKKGWRTDRGKILILYGEPLEIENRRYSTTQWPHIIWKYPDLQQFVFVDKQNNGDFTLIGED
ncbi:MAG: GWxTD domain-containing protein [Calditrichaceae bacterium]|nr:GWxTD domain-containing protein [Calditrichaceae bacterium]MBN2709245.1 GWxTD domain-containing protein [Calditrichaceae bacterium]RQV96198.1 MAG: GWxTD domain-containing protein [Calditrichota bacterium]